MLSVDLGVSGALSLWIIILYCFFVTPSSAVQVIVKGLSASALRFAPPVPATLALLSSGAALIVILLAL